MQSGMNTQLNASLNMQSHISQQIQPMGGNLVVAPPMANDQYRQKPYQMDMNMSKGSQRDIPPENRRGGDMM